MDLKETDILGNDVSQHWYYRSKAKAMAKLLDKTHSSILDVGAGSGFFSRYLLDNTSAQVAWCVDISYDCDSDALQNDKPIYFRRSIDHIESDVILFMDVLEHVDDDVGLLSDYVSKTPKGAQFLISVPAFQFLWSGHDVFLEHKRRYTLKQLEEVVSQAGLRLRHSSYFFGLVFPLAVATRLANRWLGVSTRGVKRSQLTTHSAVVNQALTIVCEAELPLLAVNRIAGLTAFCLAERP